MNTPVRLYLEKKKQEEREIRDKDKVKLLLELGLYDKVYMTENKKHAEQLLTTGLSPYQNNEYPYTEFDEETGTYKRYKRVVGELTDEEYEELKQYSRENAESQKNSVAGILSTIAYVIYVIGFIIGAILGQASFVLTVIYWCISLISGTMFLGFAEIIKLLDAIKKKQ